MKTTIALADLAVKCSFSKIEEDLLIDRKFQRVIHYTVILKMNDKRFSLVHLYKDLDGNWLPPGLEESRELFTIIGQKIDSIEQNGTTI